ncbi:MAG TPA: enolase C-terminal domain-like protein [Bryobacteraceae bacterium]|jgi:mandelate racemase
MAPKIRDVTVRPVRLPMAHPHQTASGTVAESPLVLVKILTDAGISGHGIVFTYTPVALQPTADLISNMTSLIAGEDLAPTAIAQKLRQKFRLLGTHGLTGMALAGIDMALWDALARVHNVSLVRLLGGEARAVPAYGPVGYDGAINSAKAAEEWARKGFSAVKAKIGYPDVREDLETIRAIRNAVGPDVAIMVDYNQSLTPIDAITRLHVLDGEGLTWIEEPTLAHDFLGHAQIAAEIATPIQCGENWWGALEMRHAIEARASDYMMLDLMKIGGVTGWLQASALGAAHGIRLSSHLWPETSAQLLCATPTAHFLEYADWWNPVIEAPLQIEKGMALISDAPGSGVSFNERALANL